MAFWKDREEEEIEDRQPTRPGRRPKLQPLTGDIVGAFWEGKHGLYFSLNRVNKRDPRDPFRSLRLQDIPSVIAACGVLATKAAKSSDLPEEVRHELAEVATLLHEVEQYRRNQRSANFAAEGNGADTGFGI